MSITARSMSPGVVGCVALLLLQENKLYICIPLSIMRCIGGSAHKYI
jgi:hypothetical protein